jgi:hypothetical protein
LSAVHTGAGADIDDTVGGANGILVVFHYDHGVAEVPQVDQGIEQALIVALVQADGRLVQDVHDTDQPGADLAGEADTLCFAAGQGFGAAVQRQVIQAHVHQEI